MSLTRKPLAGRQVTLCVTGSIAAYKAADLVRRLRDQGASVSCALTKAATKFVTPLLLGALSGGRAYTDPFDEDLWEMAHLKLAHASDAVVVAPASADSLAKMASGFAEDLVGMILLAARCPVLFAPAMHEPMWRHPATQENVTRLKSFGYHFVGPVRGPLASGEEGDGRMAETAEIIKVLGTILRA